MKRIWGWVGVLGMSLVAGAQPVDPSTMTGKIMCGYQGWFRTPDDGFKLGWTHYAMQGRFEPGYSAIDIWPDVSELDADEKVATPFKHADGSTAYVFSSVNPKTVMRHFKWMEDCGVDGVYLQRFVGETKDKRRYPALQQVMANVRAGAEKHQRAWAMMYDLSGANETDLMTTVVADWKRLIDDDKICRDRMYLHHAGKPVVAVWGIGFNDHRKYTLRQCLELIRFLKDDPVYGGMTVMIGVPTYWRTLNRDALADPLLLECVRAADIISPWTVGRYGHAEGAQKYIRTVARDDLQWCAENKKAFLPVVFPGFSWHNLQKGRGREATFNQTPRKKGAFLEAQLDGHLEIGATMIYQAMFDEVDEGTAVFKCSNNPPVGESRFLDMEGVPSDFYLRLIGKKSAVLRTSCSAVGEKRP